MFPELTAEEVDYVDRTPVPGRWKKWRLLPSAVPEGAHDHGRQRIHAVLVVGMGKRGMHHATAFNANPRFQVAGICDIDPASASTTPRAKLGNPQTGTDAAALARALKPDVFCFCTLPNLRTPHDPGGVESGAKLIAFEKPVALTSAERFTIRDLLSRRPASRPSSATSTATASTTRR